jgi:hypothetical protein
VAELLAPPLLAILLLHRYLIAQEVAGSGAKPAMEGYASWPSTAESEREG